jgi:hypothetical protein
MERSVPAWLKFYVIFIILVYFAGFNFITRCFTICNPHPILRSYSGCVVQGIYTFEEEEKAIKGLGRGGLQERSYLENVILCLEHNIKIDVKE